MFKKFPLISLLLFSLSLAAYAQPVNQANTIIDQPVIQNHCLQVVTTNQNHISDSGFSCAITPLTLASLTAVFTPDISKIQNYIVILSSACPCTIANPSNTPTPGQTGVFEIIQDGTGSRTIGTWGSQYIYEGGTSAITLSTAAGANDFIGYYVVDATHVLLMTGALNAVH